MARFRRAVQRQPTTAFFLLTFAFSWSLWKATDRFYLEGHAAAVPFLMFGIFGPGLMSLLVSAIVDPAPRERGGKAWALALVAAWLASSALIAIDQVLNERRAMTAGVMGIAAAAGLPAALVVSSIFSRLPGVRRQLASLARPPASPGYCVLALFLFAAVFVLGIAISRALGLPVPGRRLPASAANVGLAGSVCLNFLYTFLPNALSEEVGWRGFALPRLQARRSPLAASLLLWILWAVWHAPGYLGGFEPRSVPDALGEMSLMLPVTIVFTWIYNRAGGNLLVMGLLHAGMNTAARFLSITLPGIGLLAVLASLVVVCDRMWRVEASLEP